MIQKWNFKKKKYEPYEIPEDWYTPLVMFDMKRQVNCASCGKLIEFGDCYTSRQIHSDWGMGYHVCPECHEREIQEEMDV